MAIVHSYNNRNGVTYVYESHSYWDKENKKYKAKRKLIGKLDADGNMVPTGPKGRPKKERTPAPPETPDEYTLQEALVEAQASLKELRLKYDEDITKLYKEVDALKRELGRAQQKQKAVVSTLEKVIASIQEP